MPSSFLICSTIIANEKDELLFFVCSVIWGVSSVMNEKAIPGYENQVSPFLLALLYDSSPMSVISHAVLKAASKAVVLFYLL